MTTLFNESRASRAKTALEPYIEADGYDCDEEPEHFYVSDLLTDLMHLVGREEFNNALRMAEIHYEAELTGKE
jgi:hypothetical protein